MTSETNQVDKSAKTPEKVSFRAGWRAIGRHIAAYRGQIILLSFLGLISAAANGSVPYITGRFFDALIAVSEHHTVVSAGLPLWAFLLSIWMVAQLIANNIDWISDRIRLVIGLDLQLGIQKRGISHLLRLPLSFHKNAHINGLLQKISYASWRTSSLVNNIADIAPQILSVLIGIVLALSISVPVSMILLGGVCLYVISISFILREQAARDVKAHAAWNDAWDTGSARATQVESVKQAAAEQYELDHMEALTAKAISLWKPLDLSWSNLSYIQRMLVLGTQLLVFIVSVKFVSEGTLTVGNLITLNSYAMMFFGPFVSLGHSWKNIQNSFTSALAAEDIFGAKEELYAPQGSSSLEPTRGDVSFDDVVFGYGPDQPVVLSHISLTVQHGMVVALVGESGVGKSTLVSLISGYYFPTAGAVTIDGVDTRKLNLTKLRQRIAVVPQEVALFNESIRENIRYGTFAATDEEVEKAAHEAHIDEFVETLPQRYDTEVGERGIKLSVGQKQRVAIARAVLRDPAILILDEPTSALDAKTEQLVTESLEKLMHGRTTFIVAHRLSTVRKADLILVFEKGTIVEQGTHFELLKKDGVYRRLHDYQIGLS